MRRALLLVGVLVVTAAVAVGQDAERPPDRYDIRAEVSVYPQATARQAVLSLVSLMERKRYEYLAAHLLDPATVDARVNQKANALFPGVEKQMEDLRGRQQAKPADVVPGAMLSNDPKTFAAQVTARATTQAFREIVKDMQTHLSEYPENLDFFRQLSKDGDFAEAGNEAFVSLKAAPEKKLYLRKDGARWFVEDRKAEAKK